MQEKLQNFAQLPAHRVTDSCIVALLSHGVEGGVYGVDGRLLQVRVILWLAAVEARSLHLPACLSGDGCCCVHRTQEIYCLLTPPSSLFPSGSCKRFFGSLTMPTAQAYRTSRKCSSSRPAVEVSALADQHPGGGSWAASHQLSLYCLLLSGAIGSLGHLLLFTAATASLAL